MTRETGMTPLHIVEAALFSAGRAVSIEEIAEQEGLSKKDVEKAVLALAKIYDERDTVLEVRKAGAKWGMQVRSKAAEPAAKFAPMEIPAKTLKTLALIAYHQPLKQSELVEMVGSKAYDHVGELHEHGLVKWRKEGQTKILTVTAAFPEYFGLDAATPEQIRRTLARMVGLDPDRARGLESYAAPEAGQGGAGNEEPAPAAATPGQDGPDSDGPASAASLAQESVARPEATATAGSDPAPADEEAAAPLADEAQALPA